MLIAKIDGTHITVADYTALFPNTSFPPNGPDQAWLSENGCMPVNMWLPYDQNTQKLVPADPYIDGDWVYTVVVEPLTPEEIAQREQQAKQANKQQAESLLKDTDWTATVDISSPEYSDPYLGNQPEFLAYRSAVRKIAVNPPVTVTEWPTKPDEVWINI